jgi:glycerol-3-phosphate responsive antiterminator
MTSLPPRLPRRMLGVQNRHPGRVDADTGLLFHDMNLPDLIRLSADATLPLAADVDTIEGLAPDESAIAFLAERLGFKIVITRRPALTVPAAEMGCLSLLHVHCLDSTGMERALGTHPGPPVGTAISPGLILAHLDQGERHRLPGPVLAYGLVRRQEEAEEALAAGADSVLDESSSHRTL